MVTESKPLVSVIIASYNQKHYIFDALASVFDPREMVKGLRSGKVSA